MDSLVDLNVRLADPISYHVVFKLAGTNGLTVYDAAYLDLAVREGAQLASLDGALQSAARKAGVVLFELPK